MYLCSTRAREQAKLLLRGTDKASKVFLFKTMGTVRMASLNAKGCLDRWIAWRARWRIQVMRRYIKNLMPIPNAGEVWPISRSIRDQSTVSPTAVIATERGGWCHSGLNIASIENRSHRPLGDDELEERSSGLAPLSIKLGRLHAVHDS